MIVTGLSGAGNSTALKALADQGMYCIDNMPSQLVPQMITLWEEGSIDAPHGLAFCMDLRERSFARQFHQLKRNLSSKVKVVVIFLTADEHALVTRFSATRRKHPLLLVGDTIGEAIRQERELLAPVEEAADVVFDTSNWPPHKLARAVETHLAADLPERVLHVTITSFGFKHGQVQPVDTLFDVRFLPNPFFIDKLRTKSGMEREVRDYILQHPASVAMAKKMEDMLRFLIPQYHAEGKHYFRVGIGCTGGKHRSVCLVEELGQMFLAKPVENTVVTLLHRDIELA